MQTPAPILPTPEEVVYTPTIAGDRVSPSILSDKFDRFICSPLSLFTREILPHDIKQNKQVIINIIFVILTPFLLVFVEKVKI